MWSSKSDCMRKAIFHIKKLTEMQAYNPACYSSTTSNDQFLFNELFNAFSGSYRKAAIISNVIDNLTSRDESASKITIRQTK